MTPVEAILPRQSLLPIGGRDRGEGSLMPRRLRGRSVARSARSRRPARPPASPTTPRTSLEIWKLGGASVADAQAVRRAVGLVQRHAGDLVVVVSALKGVTDGLLEGAHRSAS